MDSVSVHLAGYGFDGGIDDGLAYRTALPRLIEVLAALDLRATFFIVGQDSDANAADIRRLVEAGHEVAAHSLSHPLGLASLAPSVREREFRVTRDRLADATGRDVVGFRAPNWDIDRRLWAELVAAGYLYDASLYPSLFHIPARVVQAIRSRDRSRVLRMRPLPASLRRRPHSVRTPNGPLLEFPVSVAPRSTIPLYHTVRYTTLGRGLDRHIAGYAARGESLSYAMHAVDVLGLREDAVDRRLGRHPGMDRPLAGKLALARSTLELVARHFEVETFETRARRIHGPAEAG
jgi:peptidoglycan/xylan/chitin deacetylase (PgdA/CDA1 family)